MKPVIEANFKPFESVRFRQNARLVSKDQLAAKQNQSIFLPAGPLKPAWQQNSIRLFPNTA